MYKTKELIEFANKGNLKILEVEVEGSESFITFALIFNKNSTLKYIGEYYEGDVAYKVIPMTKSGVKKYITNRGCLYNSEVDFDYSPVVVSEILEYCDSFKHDTVYGGRYLN